MKNIPELLVRDREERTKRTEIKKLQRERDNTWKEKRDRKREQRKRQKVVVTWRRCTKYGWYDTRRCGDEHTDKPNTTSTINTIIVRITYTFVFRITFRRIIEIQKSLMLCHQVSCFGHLPRPSVQACQECPL